MCRSDSGRPLHRSKPSWKQILSEGRSDGLSQHRLVEGQLSREATALMDLPNQNCTQRLSQVLADRCINLRSQTRPEQDPRMDAFVCDYYSSRFLEQKKGLPRSSATPQPDCGGINEGNSEWRWLEQVEPVARRPTIPVWPGWDRGQKLALPVIAPVQPVFATSQSRAITGVELMYACTPFGARTEGFILDQDGVAKRPVSSTNQKMQGPVHLPQAEESGRDADALGRRYHMTTDNLSWISAGLEGFGSVEESPGNHRGRLHTFHT